MTETTNLKTPGASTKTLGTRMLVGAAIALVLIGFFLLQVGEPDPSWPKFWMIKPLVIVPAAGATGGAFYHYMDRLPKRSAWQRAAVNIIRLVVYIVGLWLGTVLGLDGTLWN